MNIVNNFIKIFEIPPTLASTSDILLYFLSYVIILLYEYKYNVKRELQLRGTSTQLLG